MRQVSWFGGGFDLTPYYGFKDDCEKSWHLAALKSVGRLEKMFILFTKNGAMIIFIFLIEKSRARIGGIFFFDDLNHWGFLKKFEF